MQINQIVAMVPTQEQRIFLELWLPTTTQYLLSALWAQSKRRLLLLLLPQYSFSTSHKAQLISCLHLIKVVFHCYVCTSVRDEWVWCTYLPACKGLIILIHIACSTHILGILTTDESHLSMSVNRLSSHHFPLLNGQMVPEHYYTYLLIQPMPPSKISQ